MVLYLYFQSASEESDANVSVKQELRRRHCVLDAQARPPANFVLECASIAANSEPSGCLACNAAAASHSLAQTAWSRPAGAAALRGRRAAAFAHAAMPIGPCRRRPSGSINVLLPDTEPAPHIDMASIARRRLAPLPMIYTPAHRGAQADRSARRAQTILAAYTLEARTSPTTTTSQRVVGRPWLLSQGRTRRSYAQAPSYTHRQRVCRALVV